MFYISRAARKLKVHPNTIRNVEQKGLISIKRDRNGFRIFDEDDIAAIREKLYPSVEEKQT
jgi:DNA-binding transcriptional MerR regulator